ncbi:hypothetical protein D6833_08010 [Candidatus Parcubacteria bacterium]|nr:MAG: hypothetical protein D6833_08010 [Candidatus Parcubacteria bacterium]
MRNAFETLQKPQKPASSRSRLDAPTVASESPDNGNNTNLPERSHIADIPLAEQPKRNRRWEREHRGTTYRMVPHAIRDRVTALARDTGYKTDDVAQVLLDFAIHEYRDGRLVVSAQPTPDGLSISQNNQTFRLRWQRGGQTTKRKPRRSKRRNKLYNQRVTYRLPDETRDAIDRIARSLNVPKGEVVATFLEHALNALENGKISLVEE